MLNAVGYVRLSAEDSSKVDTSLQNQIKEIEDFCKNNNYNLLKIFNEGYMSGADKNRPEFQKMWSLREDHLYDAIIVRDYSRFSREQILLVSCCKVLKALGLKLLSVHGDDYTNSPMITGIFGAVSEDVIEKGKKFQRGMMDEKSINGKPFGLPPSGYKCIKKVVEINGVQKVFSEWTIDPIISPRITELFKRVAEGDDILRVTYDLGFKLHTGYRIIHNKKYIGIFTSIKRERESKKSKVLRTIIKEYKLKGWIKLTDEETFNKCNQIIRENSNIEKRRIEKFMDGECDKLVRTKTEMMEIVNDGN